MNLLPTYKENGELDTRLRVDPVTGDVGIGTPKEKKYMTKDEAVILLCEHFSEGMVRTIVDALVEDERERIKQANAPEIERINTHIQELEDAVLAEREACANTASLALLGADKALSDRVLKAIRARGQE
jgi:hypothetical protein